MSNPAKKSQPRVFALTVDQPRRTGPKLISEMFAQLADERQGSTYETWCAAQKHWENYRSAKKPVRKLQDIVRGFREYLLAQVSHNSAATYWAKFKTVCNACMDEGMDKVKLPSLTTRETHREHLSLAEVVRLVETDCTPAELKQMALFSTRTGMRWSDVEKLQYSDLVQTDKGPAIRFVQKKTGRVEYMPIDARAQEFLGETVGRNGRIFSLNYSSYLNELLQVWTRAAGIERRITFHAFRHSYAVLQLQAGTDIYTVSKGLGHSKVSTTEVYARISDEKKREAAGKVQF